MLTILAVGEDSGLLRTRAEVLQKTGANVLCSSGASAVRFIREWEFDLIVLCHSVQPRDAERITDAAHQQGSKTLVMLLASDRLKEQECAGIDLDARSFVEPDCLVRSVADLLDRYEGRTEISDQKPVFSPFARKKPASYPADIAARRALIERFEGRRAG